MSCIELSGHCSPKIIYSNNYAVNGSIKITGIDYTGISFVNTTYINIRMTGFFTNRCCWGVGTLAEYIYSNNYAVNVKLHIFIRLIKLFTEPSLNKSAFKNENDFFVYQIIPVSIKNTVFETIMRLIFKKYMPKSSQSCTCHFQNLFRLVIKVCSCALFFRFINPLI